MIQDQLAIADRQAELALTVGGKSSAACVGAYVHAGQELQGMIKACPSLIRSFAHERGNDPDYVSFWVVSHRPEIHRVATDDRASTLKRKREQLYGQRGSFTQCARSCDRNRTPHGNGRRHVPTFVFVVLVEQLKYRPRRLRLFRRLDAEEQVWSN